jgi:hypothetical protein
MTRYKRKLKNFLTPEQKLENLKQSDWAEYKNLKVVFANQDFTKFFRNRKFFRDEVFETVFKQIFSLNFFVDLQKFVYKRIELKILRYIGLKSDVGYLQLVSYLAEFGLDFQGFIRICVDGILNRDEDFMKAIWLLVKKRLPENDENSEEFKSLIENLEREVEESRQKFDEFRYTFDFLRT